MTNLEKYNNILKRAFRLTDAQLNDNDMKYNHTPNWDSVGHVEMISDMEEAFGVQFETVDIMSFSTYTAGINILRDMGVDL